MDFKRTLSRGAQAAWSRKTAATGLKGMAALAVGRWLWGKWQNRSQTGNLESEGPIDTDLETVGTAEETYASGERHEEPRAM